MVDARGCLVRIVRAIQDHDGWDTRHDNTGAGHSVHRHAVVRAGAGDAGRQGSSNGTAGEADVAAIEARHWRAEDNTERNWRRIGWIWLRASLIDRDRGA